MKPSELQDIFEKLYNVKCGYNIEDFLINKDRYLAICNKHPGHFNSNSKESLVIIKYNGDLNVAIYLAPEVIEGLKKLDINDFKIGEDNINNLCIAIEGVSHFLCFILHALNNMELSRLEMELQADIDKFVILSLCLVGDVGNNLNSNLLQTLFERYSLVKGLDVTNRQRYVNANRLAARYCYALRLRYLYPWFSSGELLGELRYFYNLSHWAKIAHIGI